MAPLLILGWKTDLAVQFALAVVSGGVAGLMAGWLLIRRQVEIQLAIDDLAKIRAIVHSLEDAKEKLSFDRLAAYDHSVETTEAFQETIYKTRRLFWELPYKARQLMSEKHKLLTAYLVLRLRRGYCEDIYLLARIY